MLLFHHWFTLQRGQSLYVKRSGTPIDSAKAVLMNGAKRNTYRFCESSPIAWSEAEYLFQQKHVL